MRPQADAIALACLTLSVAALGHALQIANGFYDYFFIVCTLCCAIAAQTQLALDTCTRGDHDWRR